MRLEENKAFNRWWAQVDMVGTGGHGGHMVDTYFLFSCK